MRHAGETMKTMSRLNFLVTANIVWLAQFAFTVAMVAMPDYVQWWRRQAPNLQLGCFEDTVRYDLLDRAFVFGLLWLLSAPLMNMLAWRIPECWPSRLTRFWWNPAAPSLSLLTAALILAVMAWPGGGLLSAPVASSLILEAGRAIFLFGAALFYRAVILSAADTGSCPRPQDRT